MYAKTCHGIFQRLLFTYQIRDSPCMTVFRDLIAPCEASSVKVNAWDRIIDSNSDMNNHRSPSWRLVGNFYRRTSR